MIPSTPNARAKLGIVLAIPVLMFAIVYGCGSDRPNAGEGQVNVFQEKCGTEGATEACHEQVGTTAGGVKVCRHGQRVCTSGSWSACGAIGTQTLETLAAGESPLQAANVKDNAGNIKVRAGLPDAAGCTNACDPNCLGYDLDAGPTVLDATTDTALILPLMATPPGFDAKLIQNGHCERYPTGSAGSARGSIACQADFFCHTHCDQPPCSPDSKDCEKFPDDPDPDAGTHAGQIRNQDLISCYNAAPDLTLGSPCTVGGQVTVAICNRGSAPVPAGATIGVSVMPAAGILPTTLPSVAPLITNLLDQSNCPSYANSCTKTLTAPLDPGNCTRIDQVACPGFNGNKVVFVNGDRAITECVFRTNYNLILPGAGGPSRHGPGGSSPEPPYANVDIPGEQQFQLGCGNNYHAWNSSQLPACPLPLEPKVLTYPYAADCPPGKQGKWTTLGWRTVLVANSQVLFDVRVRDRLYDGGLSAWSAWIPIGDARTIPVRDPAVCVGMTPPLGVAVGDGECAKDLATMLGAIQSKYEEMEVRVTMNPTSPIPNLGPTFQSLEVTYDCVDAE